MELKIITKTIEYFYDIIIVLYVYTLYISLMQRYIYNVLLIVTINHDLYILYYALSNIYMRL